MRRCLAAAAAAQPSQRELVEKWVEATMQGRNVTGPGGVPFVVGAALNGTMATIPLQLGGDGAGGLVLLPLW
jgi:hypothetical protein